MWEQEARQLLKLRADAESAIREDSNPRIAPPAPEAVNDEIEQPWATPPRPAVGSVITPGAVPPGTVQPVPLNHPSVLASVFEVTQDNGIPIGPRDMSEKLRVKRRAMQKVLSQKQERAAVLLAADELTDKEIAKKIGVGGGCLGRWKKDEAFMTRVKLEIAIMAERALSKGIARRDRRLTRLDTLVNSVDQVLRERGAARDMKGVPGGKTGLITRDYKSIGGVPIPIYRVDNPSIQSIIDLQKEAAEETGQRVRKSEVAGADGQPLIAPKLVLNFVTRNGEK